MQRAAEALPGLTTFMDTGFPWRGEEWGIWTQMVFLNQRHLASAIGILLVIVLFLLDRLPSPARPATNRRRCAEAVADAGEFADQEPASRDVPPRQALKDRLPRPANPARVVRDTLRDPALAGFALCGALAGMLPLWNGSIYVARRGPARAVVRALPEPATDARPGGDGRGAVASRSCSGSDQARWPASRPTPRSSGATSSRTRRVANVASYLAFVFGPKLLLAAVALAAASWRQWRVFIAFSGLVAVGLPDAAQRRGLREPQVHQRLADRRQRVRRSGAHPALACPADGGPRTRPHRGRRSRGDHRGRRGDRPDPREEPVDARVRHATATRCTNGCGPRRPRAPCSSPTPTWSTRSSSRGARSTSAGRTTPGLPATTFFPARSGIGTSWPSGARAVSPSSCTSGGSTTLRSTTGCDGSRPHRS